MGQIRYCRVEERVLGRKGRTSGAVKTAVAETIVEFSNGDCFYLLEKINKQATTITTTKKGGSGSILLASCSFKM